MLPSPAPSAEPSPLLCHNDILEHSSGVCPPATTSNQPETIGLRSPTEATLQAARMPLSENGGQYQPSPSQASLTQGLSPLRTQEVHTPRTANVPHARIRQSQHDRRPIPQEIQSPIVIVESPIQTQPQTLPQQPGSTNASLLSVSPLAGQARVHRPEFQDQSQSPVQISSNSPDKVSGNSPFSPTAMPQQARPRSRSGRIIVPSSLAQTHIPPPPSRGPTPLSDVHWPKKTRHPELPLLKPRVPLIQAHIASAGGSHNLNNGLEKPRFRLLIDACDTQDIFYVVLHQIFCAWDYDQAQLLSLCGLPTRDILTVAFSILGQLIRHNEGMATNHLRWFSEFPSRLEYLWATSESYQRVVADIGIFLSNLASQWIPFSRQCVTRYYPPLVYELVNSLGILSPILQGVVFTATRRNLGLSDDQFGQMAENIFSEDKRGYQELSARYHSHQPPTREDILRRNQELAARYYALTSQQPRRGTQAHLSGQGVGALPSRPPIIAINERANSPPSNPEASQFSVRFSSNMDRISGNSNLQSPDPKGNQHVTATTAGSSTPPPVAMTERPLPATSHPSHAGASTPTYRQNLAVLPPAVSSAVSPLPTTTPLPVITSQGQQAFQRPPPNLRNVGVQIQQNQNLPAGRPSTGQDRTTTSVPQPDVEHPIRSSLLPSEVQRLQWQQQRLAAIQNHRLMAGVSSAQHQQEQFLPQTQPTVAQPGAAQPGAPQHQASGVHQTPQVRSSSVSQSGIQSHASGRASGSSGRGRQPQNSAVHRIPPPPGSTNHQVQAYDNIQPPIMRPLVPPLGYTHPAEAPDPELTSLHQAHVRSPLLIPAYVIRNEGPPKDKKFPHYSQSVKGFALKPTRILPTANITKLEFTINEHDLSMKATDDGGPLHPRACRGYVRGTLLYRVRCVQAKPSTMSYSITEWAVSDTAWPDTVFIRVNGEVMEIRRKSHHVKDLPIDITSYIRPATPGQGSTNQIKITTPRPNRYKNQSCYFVAVEVIELLDHPHIIDMCHQQCIPASQTLNAIKKSLAGPTSDDDDEIMMVVTDLSVGLTDPFTAKIFDIPVRGTSCLHRECFDLKTFLTTRKIRQVGQPCMVDVWKCPICGGDARPYTLQVDNFFVDVRAKLADDNNLGVKAIWISADGSWRPKSDAPLKRKASIGFDDDDEEEGPAVKQRILEAGRAASMEAGRVVEVIELDDD